MLKRVIFIIICVSLISIDCYAMKLSQPLKIGEIFLPPMGYIEIKGAIEHKGIPFTNQRFIKDYRIDEQNRKGAKIMDKGVARFGNSIDSIYYYYDSKNGKPTYNERDGYNTVSRFGGSNINNTQSVGIGIPTRIFMIPTDKNLCLYLLIHYDASGLTGTTHTLLGRREDGVFVKYFDTYEIKKKYFSQPREHYFIRDPDPKDFIQGDTLVIKYENTGYGKSRKIEGAFRFKWDEKAQWFGIEQVVY